MARERRSASKAGRNEGRKLFAALLNNVAAASIIAAWLQPMLAFLRQHQAFGKADALGSLVLLTLGAIFLSVAQLIARRLED